MSERYEHHEQPAKLKRLEHASQYLMDRLKSAGGLEELALSIQHDYSESPQTTGQLYQLRHIARYVKESPESPPAEQKMLIDAFYVGELLAMSTIDFVTTRENTIPETLLGTIYRRHVSEWEEYTDGFDFSPNLDPEERHHRIWPPLSDERAMRKNVITSILNASREFADDDKSTEARELIHSLLREVATGHPSLITVEEGYWVIMQRWLNPDYLSLSETEDVLEVTSDYSSSHIDHDAQITEAQHALGYQSEVEKQVDAFEAQFSQDEKEFAAIEWTQEDLYDARLSILLYMRRLRAAADTRTVIESREGEGVYTDAIRLSAQHYLNDFVKKQFNFKEGDTFYAHGSFIALAQKTHSPTPSDIVLRQLLSENDAYAQGTAQGAYHHLEIRGSYKQLLVSESVSDKDSYTLDISKEGFETTIEDYDFFAPTILLENVVLRDTEADVIIEGYHSMEIPLSHSHLQLGRFVPHKGETEE